jgi:hypothetical protein
LAARELVVMLANRFQPALIGSMATQAQERAIVGLSKIPKGFTLPQTAH